MRVSSWCKREYFVKEVNADEGKIKNRLEKYFDQGLLRRYDSDNNVFVGKNGESRANIKSNNRNTGEQQRERNNLYETKQDRELDNSSLRNAKKK